MGLFLPGRLSRVAKVLRSLPGSEYGVAGPGLDRSTNIMIFVIGIILQSQSERLPGIGPLPGDYMPKLRKVVPG